MSFKKTSFNKRSYKLENDSKSGSIKSTQRSLRGVDNLGFVSNEPKLTEFILEGLNGIKNKSQDFTKSWDIDDHKVPAEILYVRYGTHPSRGLTLEQVKKNSDLYGPNVLVQRQKRSEVMKFLHCLLLGLNLLMWICAIVCLITFLLQLIATDPSDGIDFENLTSAMIIFVVVLIAGCFTYYQEFKSNRIINSFKSMIPQYTTVLRDGKRSDIHVNGIVVGDIVEVKYGDRLPADIRILESQSFKVDNSALTGESEPQKRSPYFTDKNPLETQNMAFFSTCVVEGNAKGIAVRVGGETFMGRLASLASEMRPTKTPLSKEMTRIIMIITSMSLTFGVVFFGIGISMNYTLVATLFFVIGIVIANVPENLNVVLTIILAITARKLGKLNCIVKQLHAVETLGSASVICSDKTGTITQNKMSVAHMWFRGGALSRLVSLSASQRILKHKFVYFAILGNNVAEADTSEFATIGIKYDTKDAGLQSLSLVALLCSRARFKPGQDGIPIQRRDIEGDASETAILRCMELQFGGAVEYRNQFPKVCEIPFNSRNKFQVSIHQLHEAHDPRFLLVMKGAPERILALCSSILIGSEEHELTEEWRKRVDKVYAQFGSLGERVLGFCDCRLPLEQYPPNYAFDPDNPDFLKLGFRFVGLMSMIDPPRAAVPMAVAKCKSAGVRVVMLTGDHPITAKAIARSVGIISEGNLTIEEIAQSRGLSVDQIDPTAAKAAVVIGPELACMTPDELDYLIGSYEDIVFARTSPEQKYQIVEAFQRQGQVVAVTGDGVNDSPALKKADIGIAMGVTGTDVAKEVADLVLMDDNFATILLAIEQGRQMFDNLKKLIRFTFADNVAEMYCVWIFIFLRIPTPMGTIAMILLTSGMDMAPAVSLAYERAESDIMKLTPRNPQIHRLVTAQMLSFSYGQVAVIETFAGFLAYFVTFLYNGWYPSDLIGIQSQWDAASINDLEDSYGQEWTYVNRQVVGLQAQTAFFAALVLCQWINAIACKTRRVSIFTQGLGNHFMNAALVLSPIISCLLIYTPSLNTAINFVPLPWEIWMACLPFAILLFIYDEIRRLLVRMLPGSWFSTEFNV